MTPDEDDHQVDMQPIRPQDVIRLAKSFGWQEREMHPSQRGSLVAYADPDDESRYALVPIIDDSPAFSMLMRDAIGQLSRGSKRAVGSLMLALRIGATDVWEFRFGTSSNGSVPLRDLPKMGEGVRRSLDAMAHPAVAAAKSRLRTARRGEKSTTSALTARSYMDSLEAGPTRPGSYVITVLAPLGIAAPEDSRLLDILPAPIERLVNVEIAQRFQAVENAMRSITDSTADLEPEVRRLHVEWGLGANAFKAIASMMQDLDTALDVSLVPADEHRLDVDLRPVMMTSPYVPILEQAAAILDEAVVPRSATIIGTVNLLERGPRDAHGRIAIHGSLILPGEARSRSGVVRIDLPNDEYRVAMGANEERQIVEAYGVLDTRGRIRYLTDLTHFAVRSDLGIDDLNSDLDQSTEPAGSN